MKIELIIGIQVFVSRYIHTYTHTHTHTHIHTHTHTYISNIHDGLEALQRTERSVAQPDVAR